MPHSLNKIWIHTVWSTKNREPLITPSLEPKLYEFMHEQFKALNCDVQIINGISDHVHCLFKLNVQKSISEVVKQVKGSSAHYLNRPSSLIERFAWQTGYAAFSVSEFMLPKIHNYIKNQKRHHLKKSLEDELKDFQYLQKPRG